MKRATQIITLLLLIIFTIPTNTFTQELNENLQFLKPLMDKPWVGGYADEKSSDIVIALNFSSKLDGELIIYSRDAESLDFYGKMDIYWNPELARVCFLSLTNRGYIGEGFVSEEDGKIIFLGKRNGLEGKGEFKTIMEFDSEGSLLDSFFRKKNGEWVQGHLQKFTAN